MAKKIVIAEVSMGFTMEDYADYEKLGPDDRKGYATKTFTGENLDYPMTPEGQAEFMNDIMKLIDDVPGGDGFYYWEAGWIPVPGMRLGYGRCSVIYRGVWTMRK